MPNDRYLFVFDPNDSGIGGKGDIYPREYFLKFAKWCERVKEDYKHHRANSVDHWRYYSKHKADIINHIDELTIELGSKLKINFDVLDISYKSLDIVSEKVEFYDTDKAITELYDNLVAYIGEVIRKKTKGSWAINQKFAGGDYPYIDIGIKNVQYTTVNIVWENLTNIDKVDFRKSVGKEARQSGWKANFEKKIGNGIENLVNKKNGI